MAERGEPIDYTPELAEQICSLLVEGLSLRKICSRDDMPDKSSVCRWLASNADFRDQYARAREFQAELQAEEIIDIADEATDRNNAPAIAVRVDARKWTASKLLPKKYGSFKSIEVKGEVETKQQDLSQLSYEQLYELKYGRKPNPID